MLRIAIPVVAVMLALLTGLGTKAPDRQFPIYPRPGGPPRAAAAMVKGTSLSVPRRASTTADNSLQLQVDLTPQTRFAVGRSGVKHRLGHRWRSVTRP